MKHPSLNTATQVDEVAAVFELNWGTKDALSIEDCLQSNTTLPRGILLQELIMVDLELHKRSGRQVTEEDYLKRFGDAGEIVRQAFADQVQKTTPPSVEPVTIQPSIDATADTVHNHQAETSPSEDNDPIRTSVEGRQRVGHYEIKGLIGRGGMGVVYEAYDHSLKRTVALKMIRGASRPTAEDVRRFQLEAESAGRLRHPNIVTVYDFGCIDGDYYIAMPFVEGGTLSDQLIQGTKSPRDAAELIRTLATAMHYAHEQGVLHRDLKPANILTDRRNVPWITDFGLARIANNDSGQTSTGTIMGTPQFMSPEQAQGHQRDVDARSDVYSLGALLFMVLTGRPPFQGSTPMEVVLKVINDEPPEPRSIERGIPRDLETICLKCLQKPADLRYQSAGDLAADLDRFLEGQPIQARPLPLPHRMYRWCLRNRLLTTVIALLVLLVAGSVTTAVVVDKKRQQALAAQKAEERARLKAEDIEILAQEQQLQSWTLAAQLIGEQLLDPERTRTLAESTERLQSIDTTWFGEGLKANPRRVSDKLFTHFGFFDFSVSPDKKSAVFADEAGRIGVLEMPGTKMTAELRPAKWHDRVKRERHFHEWSEEEQNQAVITVDWIDSESVIAGDRSGRIVRFAVRNDSPPQPICELDSGCRFLRRGDQQTFLAALEDGSLVKLSTDGRQVATWQKPDSFATCICRIDDADLSARWAVGFADGTLSIFDAELKQLTTRQLQAPVHALCACRFEDQPVVLASGGTDAIRPVPLDGHEIACLETKEIDIAERASSEFFHTLATDGRRLFGFFRPGSCAVWDLSDGRQVAGGGFGSTHVGMFEQPLYENMQRPPSMAVCSGNNGECSFVDQSGRVFQLKLWTPGEWNELPVAVPENSQLTALPGENDRLVALGADGTLALVDLKRGAIVHQIENAHSGPYREITCTDDGVVLTVGGDPMIKGWRIQDDRLIEVFRIPHETGLVSIAVSDKAGLIACVDDRSVLRTWDLTTRRPGLFRAIAEEDSDLPIATGCLAFNCTGDLIAAYGAGQSRLTARTADLSPVDADAAEVGGSGGLTVCWSPESPWCFVVGSKAYVRAARIHTDDPMFSVENVHSTATTTRPVADSAATWDERRVVTIENSGRLMFSSSRHLIPVAQMDTPAHDACALAITPGDSTVAIATGDGQVFVRNAVADRPVTTQTQPLRATRHVLQLPARGNKFGFGEIPVLDTSGTGALAAVLVPHGSTDRSGRIIIVIRRRDQMWRAEPLDVTDVRGHGQGVTFDSDGHLIVTFRQAAENDTTGYAGHLVVAHEQPDGSWKTSPIAPVGNTGHYSVPLRNAAGAVDEVLHFSWAGFQLLRTRRRADEPQAWDTELVRTFYGLNMEAVRLPNGDILMSSPIKRFTADNDFSRRTLIIHPDGQSEEQQLPGWLATPSGNRLLFRNQTELFEYTDRGLKKLADFPTGYEHFEIMPTGTTVNAILLAAADRRGNLYLLKLQGKTWLAFRIDYGQPDSTVGLARAWLEGDRRAAFVVLSGLDDDRQVEVVDAVLPSSLLNE